MILSTLCTQCGGRTRLIGIEPHYYDARTEIWTFECAACGEFQTTSHALSPDIKINQLALQAVA
jgi:hypothetical protein